MGEKVRKKEKTFKQIFIILTFSKTLKEKYTRKCMLIKNEICWNENKGRIINLSYGLTPIISSFIIFDHPMKHRDTYNSDGSSYPKLGFRVF